MTRFWLILQLMAVVSIGTLGCGHDSPASPPLPPLPPDGSPGTYAVSIEHNNVTREAIVYVPGAYSSTDATPLLLNFHGFGGSAQGHMEWVNMRPLADEHGFVLVYPQGSGLGDYTHWNPSPPSEDNKSNADDFGFVEQLIDTIASYYAIDANRVYATGYSNGGMMSFGMACYRGDRIAAVASVSGTMLDDTRARCTPTHPTAVITLHGTDDPILPYEGGEGLRSAEGIIDYWTDFNQISAEPETGSTNDGGRQVDSFLYTGGQAGAEVHHYRRRR